MLSDWLFENVRICIENPRDKMKPGSSENRYKYKYYCWLNFTCFTLISVASFRAVLWQGDDNCCRRRCAMPCRSIIAPLSATVILRHRQICFRRAITQHNTIPLYFFWGSYFYTGHSIGGSGLVFGSGSEAYLSESNEILTSKTKLHPGCFFSCHLRQCILLCNYA